MTTIAYKGGVLAADTQITVGLSYSYHIDKLVRVRSRYAWVGMCGDVPLFTPFLEWFEDDDAEVDSPCDGDSDDFCAIVLYDDGSVECYDGGDLTAHDPKKPVAIGSGAAAALAAMYGGASAERSVALASMVDLGTGSEVVAVTPGQRTVKKAPRPAQKKVAKKQPRKPRGRVRK